MTVLSIAVITMNREKQLYEALDSCTRCELPSDTQFVVIDNASADCTESTVKAFLKISHILFIMKRCLKI